MRKIWLVGILFSALSSQIFAEEQEFYSDEYVKIERKVVGFTQLGEFDSALSAATSDSLRPEQQDELLKFLYSWGSVNDECEVKKKAWEKMHAVSLKGALSYGLKNCP